jgi:hypothetical protein
MKRISEYTNITTVAENDILPIVDVSDTSQATTGSTKKGTIEKIADYLKSRVETPTNKTLTSPKINEDVALTANATELNLLDGETVLRRQNINGGSLGTSVGNGETKYVGLGVSTEAYTNAFIFSLPGTIKNLVVYTTGSPGVGQTYTCTFMKNGTAQTITCTIGEGANKGTDTTHSFTVSAEDRVTLRIVASATAAARVFYFGFEFDPS